MVFGRALALAALAVLPAEAPAAPRQCELVGEVCLERRETRMIEGWPVNVDCWRRQRSYRCLEDVYEPEASCEILRDRGCRRRPLESPCRGDECVWIYDCPRSVETVLDCRTRSVELPVLGTFSTDGGANADFHRVASQASAIGGAASDLCGDGPCEDISAEADFIFKGKALSCTKSFINAGNCCSGHETGWLNRLIGAQCSQGERDLGSAYRNGRAVSVGSRCRGFSLFGSCTGGRVYTSCVFSSRIARIIQRGGRAQLGFGFGSARHPNCGGFTLEQLQSLDLDAIDFSDFFSELDEPSVDIETLKKSVRAHLRSSDPKGTAPP